MKAKSNILLIGIVLLSIVLLGCGTVADYFTPADVPQRTAGYVSDDPNLSGFTTLKKAKEVRQDVLITHRDTQLDLKRLAEDDEFQYSDALEVIDFNISQSQSIQDIVLNGTDTTPGLMTILFGASGLLAGRNFLKRPGDLSPDEVETTESATS